jgi:hypothetical protein
MKKIPIIIALFVCSAMATMAQNIKGAWQTTATDGTISVMICAENYLMISRYKLSEKQFMNTEGGTYKVENGNFVYGCEFNSADTSQVGKTFTKSIKVKDNQLQLNSSEVWKNIDKASDQTPMAAAWRISGRADNNGTITAMQRGPRKTIKIMSGTRFQWAAINPQTKQFSGTGGGTYTVKDGKYTETIEFFSRDNSRVGGVLSFDHSLKGDDWHHQGLSSAGAKIYEIWSKEK